MHEAAAIVIGKGGPLEVWDGGVGGKARGRRQGWERELMLAAGRSTLEGQGGL